LARKLIAELILDPSQYIRGLRKATVASNEFAATQRKTLGAVGRGVGGKTGPLGAVAGGILGGGAAVGAGLLAGEVTQGLEASISAASDLNEQMTKTNVVFGQSAKAVEEWSKTTTTAFGVSERDALKMASSFGALFAPVGLVGKQAADQSEKLTQLGGDLASFYNTDVQSALDAIQSGLVGQVRPLRAYGVQLSAARVQQQALTDTGKKHASELTNLDKTMARIKIIFQDTQKAQGDYQRTSQGLANQTRTLKANLDDLSTTIGEALIPKVTKATQKLNDFFNALGGKPSTTAMKNFTDGLHAIKVAGQDTDKQVKDNTGSFFDLGKVLKESLAIGPEVAVQTIGAIGKAFPTDLPNRVIKFATAVQILTQNLKKLPPVYVDLRKAGGIVVPGGADMLTKQAEQRHKWFDQAVGRAEFRADLLPTLDKQITAYQKIVARLKARAAKVKDATYHAKLEDEILRDQAHITDLQSQKAQNIKDAQDKQRQHRQDIIDAAKQEHEDWLDFAYEKAQTTKTQKDNIKTAEAALAYWKHEAATGKYTVDEARKVLYWQGELNNALKKGGTNTDVLAGLMQVSSKQLAAILAAGTGLSARGRAILGANIAGAEIQPLHVHVNIDGREVGRAVTSEQTRSGRRTAAQTSGRRG